MSWDVGCHSRIPVVWIVPALVDCTGDRDRLSVPGERKGSSRGQFTRPTCIIQLGRYTCMDSAVPMISKSVRGPVGKRLCLPTELILEPTVVNILSVCHHG